MNLNLKSVSLATAITVLAMGASSANAALLSGTDGSFNSSVFISVVERSETNQILRNLMIDTGARGLDVFAGTPWSTTAAQEAEILAFVGSKSTTSTIKFNVGGALTDLSYNTELQGFLTTGNSPGPASDQSGLPALANAVGSTIDKISNANNGTFNGNGVLAANNPTDPGFHAYSWGDNYNASITPSNEVLLGADNQIVGWQFHYILDEFGQPFDAEIIRSVLGGITSNLQSGDISFNTAVVPVPAAAWLLASAFGALLGFRRTARSAA